MNLAYKFGVKKFYNMIATAGHFTGGFKWAFGYGLGTQVKLGGETVMNVEALSFEIFDNLRYWSNTSLHQARFNFGMEYADGKSFFVGPTFNVLITELYQPGEIAPYVFFNHDTYNNNIKMWIGLNGGFRF